MIVCPKCKAEIEEQSWFCDQCGQMLKYCVACGKVGKGNRCTSCGGLMKAPAEQNNAAVAADPKPAQVQTPTYQATQATSRLLQASAEPIRLWLTSPSKGLRLEAADGAIIGRRNGPYSDKLARESYVSGTHARLNYVAGQGWTITDMNSSNGTMVEHDRLVPGTAVPLKSGEHVSIANVEFVVEIK